MTTSRFSAAQQQVQERLDRLVAEEREQGIQVAAYARGQLAVHAWAGVADTETGRAVDTNTLSPIFPRPRASRQRWYICWRSAAC